jgi:hypothetical protein
MTAPIIVTALLGPDDFAWADGLRRAHFPPERNHLRAHLTLFHHLPPTVERELSDLLRQLCKAPAPVARLASVVSLGRGVAYVVDSPELHDIRAQVAERFATLLIQQDKAGWRPHITVQNKVAPPVARALLTELQAGFRPRPLAISGLAAWWYRGGPWEAIGAWGFGTGHAIKPSH